MHFDFGTSFQKSLNLIQLGYWNQYHIPNWKSKTNKLWICCASGSISCQSSWEIQQSHLFIYVFMCPILKNKQHCRNWDLFTDKWQSRSRANIINYLFTAYNSPSSAESSSKYHITFSPRNSCWTASWLFAGSLFEWGAGIQDKFQNKRKKSNYFTL